MKKLIILGITGSIGCQVVDIVRENKEDFEIVGFSFYNNISLGKELIKEFNPRVVAIKDEYLGLKEEFPNVEFLAGKECLSEIVKYGSNDIVILNALVGLSGLKATFNAINAFKNILLANKETLVVGGDIIMNTAKEKGVSIVSIDSEHSAIFQALVGEKHESIKKLVLTSSGGALRDFPLDELKNVTKAQVLAHPNWNMGQKITVDCATMVNKAFEVMEAHYLFDVPLSDIEVLIHKESIVHSLVLFKDQNYKAILSKPDMHLPISYALYYPDERLELENDFDLTLKPLTFEHVNLKRYPCFELSLNALKKGGAYPCVLNACNEALCYLFLHDLISFEQIGQILEEELSKEWTLDEISIDSLIELDSKIKYELIEKFGGVYPW